MALNPKKLIRSRELAQAEAEEEEDSSGQEARRRGGPAGRAGKGPSLIGGCRRRHQDSREAKERKQDTINAINP